MANLQESIKQQNRGRAESASTKTVADLLAMDGPPQQFLAELLDTQCQQAQADAAVLLRIGPSGQSEVLATHPRPETDRDALSWIRQIERPFRKVMLSAETVIVKEAASSSQNDHFQRYLMVIPIKSRGVVKAAAAFRLRADQPQKLMISRAYLETTPLLLEHHELQMTTKKHVETMDRLRRVMTVLDAINQPARFLGAAMALCNEIALWLNCSRVSLGFLEGRTVQVKAMSHTDTFSREMQVVQAIEAAMEECLDQDLEVIHPTEVTATVASRAAAELAGRHGPSAVISLPIRQEGEVAAVLTLERAIDRPFDRIKEIEAVRLTCDLCARRLLELHHNDGWFVTRLLKEARQWVGKLVGHEHTWAKIVAAFLFVAVMLLATVKGEYRIHTTFALKAQHQQVVVAPFDTFSKSVDVEPGDRVEAGKTVLGTLETAELRLKLAALQAEKLGYQKQMTAFMRDRKTADAQIAETQSRKVTAQIRLIEKKIEQANIVAPINGWVISEDRKQQIGAPVKAGEVLFEIATIDSLWAELHVPESSIASITQGFTGTMASVGHPGQKVGFTIDRINPIAEVVDHQNVFRVRARIFEQLEWMRPGMEGEAKISAGKKTYLWIYSHGFVNWLRMKLWI